jgi:hypothetical protein
MLSKFWNFFSSKLSLVTLNDRMTICCWVGSLNSLNPSNFNLQYLAILYSIWWLIVTVNHMWPFSSQWFVSHLWRWQFYANSIQNLLEQLDILLTKSEGSFAIGSTKGPKFKCIMLAHTKCIRGAHCKLRPRWLGAFF